MLDRFVVVVVTEIGKYGNLVKNGKCGKYRKSAELKGGNVGKDENDGKAKMAEIFIKCGKRKRQK